MWPVVSRHLKQNWIYSLSRQQSSMVQSFWLRWSSRESRRFHGRTDPAPSAGCRGSSCFYSHLLHLKEFKSALRLGELILNLCPKATLILRKGRGLTAANRSQGCWPMTLSIHFLYSRAKRLCSGLRQLSRTELTKLYSEDRAGGSVGRTPLFSRLLSRGSGRDAPPSTSIASPVCRSPFTRLWASAVCRFGPSTSSGWAESLPPLLLPWWQWSRLQWCHK